MAADVRQSKDFSFLFLLTSPFLDACTTDEGKDTPRGITRRIESSSRDQNRMVGQTKLGSDQNLFSTFRFSTSFVAGTLAASGIPLCPHIVGRRGFIGAGSRLQVSPTLLLYPGCKIWSISFILPRFLASSSHWAVVTFSSSTCVVPGMTVLACRVA